MGAKKFVVITGGVISGIGKGIFAASTARILKDSGVNVNTLKIDPYLNVDAGTMNPNQHGEVFVTDDGYEADLDLGHYERFLGQNMTRFNNLTAGQVYWSVIQKEREGRFLGATVQMVPHVTEEIKSRIKAMDANVGIVEIGGTVGDIEGEIFLEAVRELSLEMGRENFVFIHVTFVPYLKTTNEFKTKPTQQSIQLLRRIGIQPDFLVVRSESPMEAGSLDKVALFGGVPRSRVINLPDTNNVYEIPEKLYRLGLHQSIAEMLNLKIEDNGLKWEYPKSTKPVRIALIGKYLGTDDAYKSIFESLILAGVEKPFVVDAEHLEEFERDEDVKRYLSSWDGLIIPGGFGKRGIEGKIRAIKVAREEGILILGICLGMQLMVIEFARNVAGLEGANSTEFDPETPHPVIDLMEEQKKILKLGGTMRLGAQWMKIFPQTRLSRIYRDQKEAYERHRHRYEVNYEKYRELFCTPEEVKPDKLLISAMSDFVEAIEIPDHPFFIGVQYHPEYKSKVGEPHPLFVALVEAAERKGL
ncbi:MAG TPA: CTP synthetase [Thermotogae bacterium]|nr:CTP synthetase [Thermotogota bacterium]